MSKYEAIHGLSDERFRRLTGVKQGTFAKMAEILINEQVRKKRRGGRPNKRRYAVDDVGVFTGISHIFSIGQGYSPSEPNAYQTIKWVEEDTLIKDGTFSLPGRKALLKSDAEFEVILVDAAETPSERPKRGRENGIQVRKSGTR